MAKYALLENGAFTGRIQDFDGAPPVLAGKPQFKWVPYAEGAKPAYDPLTQKLQRGVAVGPDGVTETFAVVDLPLAEAQANKLASALTSQENSLGQSRFRVIALLALGLDALSKGQALPAKTQAAIDAIKQAITANPEP
jgi:hypothetical protein